MFFDSILEKIKDRVYLQFSLRQKQEREWNDKTGTRSPFGKWGLFTQTGIKYGTIKTGGSKTEFAKNGIKKPEFLKTELQKAESKKLELQQSAVSQNKLELHKQEQRPFKSTSEQSAEKMIQKQHEFEMWRKQETERLETGKQNLRRQTRKMEQERIQLNIEKAHFYRQQEFQETKKKHEEHLLEMKRQILEGELYKLAEEKKQFEQKKSFYDQVEAYQKEDIRKKPAAIHGTMFFAGVNSQSSLKKRYKDLLKIYHPDNKCGDTDAIQEINREYQRLMAKLQG
ncbi:hypothetical protein C823_001444 [Eubacterium plexicaudatum ASF492]|nr:hypothetical protein C823_001444 [Eubacterium plexicaudatum ASF492]